MAAHQCFFLMAQNTTLKLTTIRTEIMNVGDIARRADGQNLHSGSCAYGAAVVVQVEPLVLVSEGTDMRWESTVQDVEF